MFWAASDVGLGGRALLHRLRAAAGRVHDGAVRGQAGRHPGRGRVLAGDRRAQGQGAVHRADRVPRDQEGGPGAASWPASTTCPGSGTCSWPGSGSTRRPTGGRASCSASRSSTTGGRPRPAGPIAADLMGLEPLPTKAGLAHHAGARLRRADRRRRRRRGRARRDRRDRGAAAAAARAACPRCGATTSGSSGPTCRRIPASTSPATAGTATSDGYLYVMGRIDDVINVAGHRLSTGQMEEVLASHPAVAECAVIGVQRRAQGPDTARVRGAQGRRQRESGRAVRRACPADPRPDRAGRRAAPGRRGRRPAQDPVRQDPAQDHARHRRRPGEPVPSTIEDPAVLDALRPVLAAGTERGRSSPKLS